MNDSTELDWGKGLFLEACAAWLKSHGQSQSNVQFIEEIQKLVLSNLDNSLPLAACFSLDGDLLSLWRGYSSNGAGFAIGFDPLALNSQYKHTAFEAIYNRDVQLQEITEWIDDAERLYPENLKSAPTGFRYGCGILSTDLVAHKNPAFREEIEIRLVTGLTVQPTPNGKMLTLPLYTRDEPIGFLMRNGVPAPYVDRSFANDGRQVAIREVVIGPKNRSKESDIAIYLETLGIQGVKVRKSGAPYK